MKIGCPKERKLGEKRVALTPDGTAELLKTGHQVIIEIDAGAGSGFSNQEYLDAGAILSESLAEVWQSDLVIKVKEPHTSELEFFRPGLGIFCFLHPAVFPEIVDRLLLTKTTCFDYDLLSVDGGRLPILEPMSIIAGKLSVQIGASLLESANGGRGILLGGAPGVKPAKVVVFGGGASGSSAVRIACGMGAKVTLFDLNLDKLSHWENTPFDVTTLFPNRSLIVRELTNADLVIGAVLIPGAKAPKILDREIIRLMPKGSVIVDIAIDQGGFSTTSKATSISEPTYIVDGVIHYCVPNMPALVPRTSTIALTNTTLRWLDKIVSSNFDTSIGNSNPIRRSVITHAGKLLNEVVAESLGLKIG